MALRKAQQKQVDRSTQFSVPSEDIESEIIELYARYTASDADEDELLLDLTLDQLPSFLRDLHIPSCLVSNTLRDVETYQVYMTPPNKNGELPPSGEFLDRSAEALTNAVVRARETVEQFCIPDTLVVDMDKLIRQATRLVKMRNAFAHLMLTWKMVVDVVVAATEKSAVVAPAEPLPVQYETFALNLKHLRVLKGQARLDETFSDGGLIDMISMFSHGRATMGICDFGEILGLLGELE